MEKGYLDNCVLGLSDTTNPNTILEAYKFTVKSSFGSGGKAEMHEQAEEMLGGLSQVFKAMEKLPEDYTLQFMIKLNDTAPDSFRVSPTKLVYNTLKL